jgi:3-oxoacyl-[acyl-carrier-protein] synthase-3
MWAGSSLSHRGDMRQGWSQAGPSAAHEAGAVALLQDFALLKEIIRAWLGVYLEKVDEGRIRPGDIDWFLCHYSARSLRQEIVALLTGSGAMIPEEKWFTTLPSTGNVGSASIWLMLDALLKSGRAKPGDKLLCVVPESGRAIVGFMQFEVVG